MTKKAIIFDMDGVIVDSEPLWGIAMHKVFSTIGFNLTPADYAKTTGLKLNEVIDYWHNVRPWTNKSKEIVITEIYEGVESLIHTEGHLMSGIKELLEQLKSNDYKIGLASSSSQRLIRFVLQHFGLTEYFDHVHSAEKEVFGKPHPAVFISCAQALKTTNHQEIIVIEDSVNGLIAAKAARMRTIAMPDERRSNDPRFIIADKIVHSLTEINQPMLDEIFLN